MWNGSAASKIFGVLTGATGFVGSDVFLHLAANPEVSKVTCLSRRPVVGDAPKVTTIMD
jgi:hypothetical protein